MHETNISPLARRLAEENNVYWQHLMGTGPEGKVVEKDVIEYLHRVMAGEESINSTPEPLPVGMTQWPQEDLANLVIPGQEQYGGEMQTSWQNEAIADLEDLEESKPSANLVDAQTDVTDAYVSQSSDLENQTLSGQDDLDDSLLLNDNMTPQPSSQGMQSIQGVHGVQGLQGLQGGVPQQENVQINQNGVEDIDVFADDLDTGDINLDGLPVETQEPQMQASQNQNVTELFSQPNINNTDFGADDVDALLDKPVNMTGFGLDDDALDFLDDDFGIDLDSNDDFGADLNLDTDISTDLLTTASEVGLTETGLTETGQAETMQSESVSNPSTKDTIDTLFYDETELNESAFDAELDDLLFEGASTGYEEPKATQVESNDFEKTSIDESVVDIDEGFSDDLQVSGDTFGGLEPDPVPSLESASSNMPDDISDSEFDLFSDSIEEDTANATTDTIDTTNTLESPTHLNDTFAAVDLAQTTDEVVPVASVEEVASVDEFDDLFDDSNGLSMVQSTDETTDGDTQSSIDAATISSLDEFEADTQAVDNFDDLLGDIDAFDNATTFTEDASLAASPILDEASIDESLDAALESSIDESDYNTQVEAFENFDDLETVEAADSFENAETSAIDADSQDILETQDIPSFLTGENEASEAVNLDATNTSESLSDFDIADTDFGSADERLDDQSFSTRDDIATSFNMDDGDEDIFAAIEESQLPSAPEPIESELIANFDDELLATATDDEAQSPEDKALADAFLDSDSFFDDDVEGLEDDLFASDAAAVSSEITSEVESLDFLDDFDSETPAPDMIMDKSIEDELTTNLDVSDDAGDVFAATDTVETTDERSFLSEFDAENTEGFETELETSLIESSQFDSSQDRENLETLESLDDDDLFNSLEDTNNSEVVTEPATVSDVLEAEELGADAYSVDAVDAIADNSLDSDTTSEQELDIDSDIDRRFEEALDTAAEQADPYTQSNPSFGDDDIFSDSEGLSFNDDSFDSNDENQKRDPTLTWSDVDLDEEDPLVELERELASELSQDLDFLDNDADTPDNSDASGLALGAAGVAGLAGAAIAASNGANNDSENDKTGENWGILEEILEDDEEDILAEQAGEVQLGSDLENNLESSPQHIDKDLIDDFDLESSLEELEAELNLGSTDESIFKEPQAELSTSDEKALDSDLLADDSQDQLLNQMFEDTSVIDDVTASALIEEASRGVSELDGIDALNLNSVDDESIAIEESTEDNSVFLDNSISGSVSNISTSQNAVSGQMIEQTLSLQNYQVARRYVELTNLLAANRSIGQELSTKDDDENTQAISASVLLTKAAAKAMEQFPLGSNSTTVLVSKFSKEGSSYLSVDDAVNISIKELVSAVDIQNANAAQDGWFTSQTSDYQQQLSNCHLVVADLSAYQLDELVTSEQKPVLALGRIVKENDDHVSTLSLSGNVDLESASAFLARVAFLLSDPIRLLV